MSWTTCSHPMPALYCFVIMWLCHTPLGVGCLICHHERTRLTSTTINRAIIVRCKSIKKLSIKSHFEMEKFVQILILTQNNPNFTLISNVLCHGTLTYRQKSKKQIQMSQLSIWCSPIFGYYLLSRHWLDFKNLRPVFNALALGVL